MAPEKAPRPVRRQHGRLSSAKNPSGRQQRRTQTKRSDLVCPNPDCPDPTQIETMDDQKICGSCGTLIEDSMIHADVTFGESAAGAAVVQGGFVGEGQRFAKSLGTAFRRVGGTESREVTENQGRDEIRKQCYALRISEDISNKAFRIYKLAAVNGFIQGRRVRIVVASAIYIGCRQQKKNTVLMMDFAELLQVSVYKIGQCYEDLKKTLYMDDNFDNNGLEQVEVESYIERFANRLEFGSKTIQVSEDACRLMKRMKRDWMVTGRAPAGLCGACLILAARMNNFRRTVREVVYVVKVCDITIAKRLEEFKRTKAASLSVEQFREFGNRLKHSNDPPAIYEAKLREEKKKRKLAQQTSSSEPVASSPPASAVEESDQVTEGTDERTAESDGRGQRAKRRRLDKDGFAIPDAPVVDPQLVDPAEPAQDDSDGPSSPPKRKRGRPRKDDAPLPVITAADLEVEDLLEQEMESYLEGGDFTQQMEEAYAEAEAKSKEIAAVEKQREELEARLRRSRERSSSVAQPQADVSQEGAELDAGHPYNGAHITAVSSAEDIAEDEFDDDPEVMRCLLTPAEVRVKESIWVTHNEDWLRAQQAKMLKKALDEANGRGKTGSKTRKKRQSGRMGDGSLLEGEEVASAAEASAKMLDKRAGRGKGRNEQGGWGFSKHVNYEALKAVYGGDELAAEAASTAGDASRDASAAPGETETAEPPRQLPTPDPTQEPASSSRDKAAATPSGTADADAGAQPAEIGDGVTAVPNAAEQGEDEEDYDDDEDDEEEEEDAVERAFAGGYDDEDEDEHVHYDDDDDDVGFDDVEEDE